MAPMELRRVRLSDDEARPLLADLAREYEARYGPGDEMASTSPEEFDPPDAAFLILTEDGITIAGGGIRRLSGDTCEVKRMWTAPGHRRRGHASAVLKALEDVARSLGYSRIRAETGPAQPEAVALYRSHGYGDIPCYGPYDAALAFELRL